jgi:hypothetical protein
MNEKEIEALKRIEFFSRNHGYKLGLAEEKVGVPHHILVRLQDAKLIFSKSKFGVVYWYLTRSGKSVAGQAARGQLVEAEHKQIGTIPASLCSICEDLGIIATPETMEKAVKSYQELGIYGLTPEELHLVKNHQAVSINKTTENKVAEE